MIYILYPGFPGGSVVNNLPANAEHPGWIPWLGSFPGVGNGNLLWYSCLENSMDKEPGKLQSMKSQRVGHDLSTNQQQQFIILST